VLDIERAAADEIGTERFQLGAHRAVAVVLRIRFTPAVDAFVSLNFDEDEIFAPAGMDRIDFDGRDFHVGLFWRKR